VLYLSAQLTGESRYWLDNNIEGQDEGIKRSHRIP
jgi:hypothetical protein